MAQIPKYQVPVNINLAAPLFGNFAVASRNTILFFWLQKSNWNKQMEVGSKYKYSKSTQIGLCTLNHSVLHLG